MSSLETSAASSTIMLSPTAKPFAKPFAKPIHLEVSSSNPVYKFRVTVREASYNCFAIDRSAESGGSRKLYSTIVSLLSYHRLILRILATCSFPMLSHMYLCTTCCTERWLWSTMPSMDCRKGFIPGLMRGFEGFLLQGFPESPWGYVPRIVH